jgi:shikimate dehydrogenase
VTADRYGVMGYPVSQSRSPVIHHLFALQTGEQIHYERLRVSPERLEEAVRQFQQTGGKGLNVTVPHKRAVCRLVDHLSERASLAGAVNTLTFRNNEVYGDNTDGVGLLRDLTVNLGLTITDTNILLLGAGGATRGIVGPLLEMRPSAVLIANRTLKRAEELVDRFSSHGNISACRFSDTPVSKTFHLIINATSAGLKGEVPPYPETAVSNRSFCYDLSYGANSTPFCAWARQHGAGRCVMGWGMLVEQAAESFHIWRGIRPDTAPVLEELAVNA